MDSPDNKTLTHILDAAERLFLERGYVATSLRDIGAAVGMRHASLYYYAPGGKETLYIEVMKRSFQRHHDQMENAIRVSAPDLRSQLRAVAHYLITQPPMDLMRMEYSDLPAMNPALVPDLLTFIHDTLRGPVEAVLKTAQETGVVGKIDIGLVAISFIALIQSLHLVPIQYIEMNINRAAIADETIEILLTGLLKR